MACELRFPEDSVIVSYPSSFGCIERFEGVIEDSCGEKPDLFLTREIRFSLDGKEWSAWLPLERKSFPLIKGNDVWIELKYIRSGSSLSGNIQVKDVQFNIVECVNNDKPVLTKQKCCFEECEAESLKIGVSTIDYYKTAALPKIHEDLSETAFEILGHCVTYYRVKPDKSSGDAVLKEWSVYDGFIKKDIQIIVNGNENLTGEPKYNPYGVDFAELPVEFHISKKDFECEFGEGERPQRKDFLFFPLINAWYRIESSWFKKDWMGRGTFYIAHAFKWEDDVSVLMNPEEREEIDDTILSIEDVFGQDVKDEIKKTTNPDQLGTNLGSKDDPIREYLNTKIVKDEDLYVNWTHVSKNYYDLRTVDQGEVALTWRKGLSFSSNESYSFQCWINLPKGQSPIEREIISIERVSIGSPLIKVVLQNVESLSKGDPIQIKDSMYEGSYTIEQVTFNEVYIKSPWLGSSFDGRLIKPYTRTVLNGYDTQTGKGLGLFIYETGAAVLLNGNRYLFDLSLTNDSWYGIFFNFELKHGLISLYTYRLNPDLRSPSDPKSNRIINNSSQSINLEGDFEFGEIPLRLVGSNILETNIRVWTKTVEPEQHLINLTRQLETNAHLALIIDNARNPLRIAKVDKKF